MKDTDLMPFGTHKGKAMANVPASYLLWLAEQDYIKYPTSKTNTSIKVYIDDNIDILKKEKR